MIGWLSDLDEAAGPFFMHCVTAFRIVRVPFSLAVWTPIPQVSNALIRVKATTESGQEQSATKRRGNQGRKCGADLR